MTSLCGAPFKVSALKPVTSYAESLGRSASTGIRWCTNGIPINDSITVKLRFIKVGRTYFTTDDWFSAFVAAQTADTECGEIRTPAERLRASEKAGKELEAIGA